MPAHHQILPLTKHRYHKVELCVKGPLTWVVQHACMTKMMTQDDTFDKPGSTHPGVAQKRFRPCFVQHACTATELMPCFDLEELVCLQRPLVLQSALAAFKFASLHGCSASLLKL